MMPQKVEHIVIYCACFAGDRVFWQKLLGSWVEILRKFCQLKLKPAFEKVNARGIGS